MNRTWSNISTTLFIVINLALLISSVPYFVQNPAHLGYVAAIAFGGGLATAIYYKFPQTLRRKTKLFLLGVLVVGSAICFVAAVATTIFLFVLSSNQQYEFEGGPSAAAGVLFVSGALLFGSWRDFTQARNNPD